MLRLGQICGIRLPMGGRTHETMTPRNLKNPLSKSLIALGINPYHASQERVSMFMLSKLSVSSLCATQQSMSEPGDFYCFISLVDWCEACQPDCDATTHNLSRLLQSGQNFGQLASCHGIETSSFILVYSALSCWVPIAQDHWFGVRANWFLRHESGREVEWLLFFDI